MNLSCHHVGKVVDDIKKEYSLYASLGFRISDGFETIKIDREQKVLVGAVELDNIIIELLEPLSEDSPITAFQRRGGGLHHICYEVHNLQSIIDEIKGASLAIQITPITKSVWDGKKVVFFFDRSKNIIELIGQK